MLVACRQHVPPSHDLWPGHPDRPDMQHSFDRKHPPAGRPACVARELMHQVYSQYLHYVHHRDIAMHQRTQAKQTPSVCILEKDISACANVAVGGCPCTKRSGMHTTLRPLMEGEVTHRCTDQGLITRTKMLLTFDPWRVSGAGDLSRQRPRPTSTTD